jgi:hypothetical protein
MMWNVDRVDPPACSIDGSHIYDSDDIGLGIMILLEVP